MATIICLWEFECDDIQIHKKAYCLKPNLGIECPFCSLIAQHQSGTCKESAKRWLDYFTKDRNITIPGMKRKISNDIPVRISSIDFNHKQGFAFFKDEIEPEAKKHDHGGRHILQMFGQKDNKELADKHQEVMRISIEKIYRNKTLLASINGIFIRGEVNSVMSMAKDAGNYANPTKLPYMLRLEIWIPKDFKEKAMEELDAAKNGIEVEMRGMGLVEGIHFNAFTFNENKQKSSSQYS